MLCSTAFNTPVVYNAGVTTYVLRARGCGLYKGLTQDLGGATFSLPAPASAGAQQVARYFFCIKASDTPLADDEEGQEFATLEAVRHEAIETARQILSDAARSGKAASLNLVVEVLDETGEMVLTVPVGHAIGTEAQS